MLQLLCRQPTLPRYFLKLFFFVNILSGIEIQYYYIFILKSYEIIRKPFNDTSPITPCRTKFEIVI